MATVDVELTIASARDLKNVNWKHGDLCAYAAAWIDDGAATRVRTKTDGSGDTAPCWDQKFTLTVAKQSLEQARLVVEVFHDKRGEGEEEEEEGGAAWRKKAVVGRASLPLLEVVDAGAFDDVQDYTVTLKRPSGRPHGKLELSIRLRERRGAYGATYGGQRDVQPPYPGYTSAYPAQPYGQGYPAAPQGYPAPSSAYPASSAYPYTPQPQPYAPYAAPQPYPSYAPSQPYGAPPGSYGYQQPYPSQYQQQTPPPQYQQQNPPPQKAGSKFGGLGAGLAAGALAGAIGGIALDEFVDHKEDEAAEDQADYDAERYDDDRDDNRDDDYGGGDDGFF